MKIEALADDKAATWALILPGRTWMIIGTVAEAVLALALVSPWWRSASFLAVFYFGATIAFMIALVSLGMDVGDCGCFGLAKIDLRGHIAFLVGGIMLAIVSLMGTKAGRAAADS